jgi:hypothetical protein
MNSKSEVGWFSTAVDYSIHSSLSLSCSHAQCSFNFLEPMMLVNFKYSKSFPIPCPHRKFSHRLGLWGKHITTA